MTTNYWWFLGTLARIRHACERCWASGTRQSYYDATFEEAWAYAFK